MFKFDKGENWGYSTNRPVASITHTLNRRDVRDLLNISVDSFGLADVMAMINDTAIGAEFYREKQQEIESVLSKVAQLERQNNMLYTRLEESKKKHAEAVRELRLGNFHGSVTISALGNEELENANSRLSAELSALKRENAQLVVELAEAKDEAGRYKVMATHEVIEMSRKLTQGPVSASTAGKFYCTVEGGRSPKVTHADSNTALIEARRLANSLNARVWVTRLVYTVKPTSNGLCNIDKES